MFFQVLFERFLLTVRPLSKVFSNENRKPLSELEYRELKYPHEVIDELLANRIDNYHQNRLNLHCGLALRFRSCSRASSTLI